ncbi:MAG: DUF3298 domain-containing protein [Clostridia bacterium]|nr:DUF3298 domain-containing protein [Clostridia bacterium]
MSCIICREIRRQIPVTEGCVLDFNLTYPELCHPSAVTVRYRLEAEGLLQRVIRLCRTTLPALPKGVLGERLRFEYSYTIGWEREDMLSLYFDCYEDLGLFHTGLGRRSEVWRLPEGRLMGNRELFRSSAEVRRRVNAHIEAEMSAAPTGHWFGGWQHKPRWFFLTERGLCVYFRPGDIAAGAAGIPVFLIPWSALEGCLNFPL